MSETGPINEKQLLERIKFWRNCVRKADILKTLNSIKAEVRQSYKAEIKGIFGSYARGDEKKDSDIDVLVNFLEGATLF